MNEPTTEAGRTLLDVSDHLIWDNGNPVSTKYMADAIADIEREAAASATGIDTDEVRDLLMTCRSILAPQGYSGVTHRIDRILAAEKESPLCSCQSSREPGHYDTKPLAAEKEQ